MDYLSLKAACRAADAHLRGRRLSSAWNLSRHEVALDFGGRALVLSIQAERPGLFLAPEKPARLGDADQSFSMFISSRFKGGTLKSIEVPWPGERAAVLVITAGWPRQALESRLILEVMGRHSNLVLVGADGLVAAPLKAVPTSSSRVRPMLSGLAWSPAPPRPGLPIEQAVEQGIPDGPVAHASDLAGRVMGLSPWAAQQVILRAGGTDPKDIALALAEMTASDCADRGYLTDDGHRLHLSPFQPVGEVGSVRPFGSFAEAAWAWREEGTAKAPNRDTDPLLAALDRLYGRVAVRRSRIADEELRCAGADLVRRRAEALLLAAPAVPRNALRATLPDPSGGPDLVVDLDPALSPRQNADRLFTEARRLKRGQAEVAMLREPLAADEARIDSARAALLAGDPEPARALVGGILSGDASVKGERGHRRTRLSAGRRFEHKGFTILVGRSAKDNERVTFEEAAPSDLWIHTRDYPGSHVVVLGGKRAVPDDVVRAAALLAAENSGARGETAPEIMVTERKWVRRLKGGKPGQVTVERFRTIRVKRSDQTKT